MSITVHSCLRTALVSFAALTCSVALAATPTFNAELTVGKESRFLLLSPDGKPSGWLKIGDSYDGYSVDGYNAKTNTLDLKKDGQVSHLVLASDATVAAASTPIPATVADATATLDAMHFETMLSKSLAGVKQQQLAMLNQMLSHMAKPGVDKAAVTAFQQKVLDMVDNAITGGDIKGDVSKMYSEVFTKDELNALADFYASPVGQSFADKQPLLAQKMNALMMPRLMAVMPKIQQMAQQFAANQAPVTYNAGTAVGSVGGKTPPK